MAGKVRNPDSWFYRARLSAGFPNAALLAERLGVPKITVYQWERGSAAVRSSSPTVAAHAAIAEALVVPLPQTVQGLWRETMETRARAAAEAKRCFPGDRPGARTLAIEIPCANAERKGSASVGKKVVIVSSAQPVQPQLNEYHFAALAILIITRRVFMPKNVR